METWRHVGRIESLQRTVSCQSLRLHAVSGIGPWHLVSAKDHPHVFKIALAWESFKVWLTDTLPFTHHDYHLLLGVLLTLGFGWVLRRPLGS